MPDFRVALWATLSYFLVLACGMAVLGGSPDALTLATVGQLLVLELALCGLCLFWFGGRWGLIFGATRWRGLVWLIPAVLVLVAMGRDLLPVLLADTAVPWGLLFLIGATSLLIGFSEEVMFRGILLRGLLARFGSGPAILLSAAAFALVHLLDGVSYDPVAITLQELAFTFLIGLGLAPVALRVGALWPLILWHALWDSVVFSSQVMGVMHPLAVPGMLTQVLVGLLLWSSMRRDAQASPM